MKTGIFSLVVAVCLLIGFGCGWAVSQARSADRLSPETVYANDWIADVGLLTGGGRRTNLLASGKVAQLVGMDLNTNSIVLARLYDGMPQSLKARLLSFASAARVIGTSQGGTGSEDNRRDLLSFVSCMEQVKVQGGLVGSCVKAKSK